MKTIIGFILAIGLMSTTASAWYCPPGFGYGNGHSHSQSFSQHRPSHGDMQRRVVEKAPEPMSPPAGQSQEPQAEPAPEPVPQK